MAKLSLQQFADYARGALTGDSEKLIERIVFDSRKLLFIDHSIFIAIKGLAHNGHDYIPDLYKRGLRAFMVEKGFDTRPFAEAGFVVVDNVVEALQKMVSGVRQHFRFPIVGITGSNGKTIVKEWGGKLLEGHMKVGRSPRSYNSQLGVPLSVFMLEDDCQVALVEAGISKPGEMESLEKVVAPEIGLITNIGQAHQENFMSLEHKLGEKLALFKHSAVILYCADHVTVSTMVRETYRNKKLLSFGVSPKADLKILQIEHRNNAKKIMLSWKAETFELVVPFGDRASVENVLIAVLLALHMGIEARELAPGVGQLQPVAMRLEQKDGVNNCILIDDAYNSDLTSLELALDFLVQMGARKGLSKRLILSDIYQSGMEAKEWYAEIQKMIRVKGIDHFVGIGPELYRATGGVDSYRSTEEFLNHFHINSFKDEAILLKGSRAFSFEKISSLLEQKRHKTVLEVNLNALNRNVQFFKSLLQPGVKMLAMVKAFSYGSGSFEIANQLQNQNVDYLGVAFADEGIELREAGINMPIVVMNPEVSSFPLMLRYELEPEIYSFGILEDFISTTRRQGMRGVAVHIKVDSGMNRLGFLPSEIGDLAQRLNEVPELKVASVFSHLAGSDEAGHDEFTRRQAGIFVTACDQLQKEMAYPFIRHLLNSAGIERFPDYQLDMVRLGIGMYGISAQHNALQVVGRLKSYISQIKTVPKGQSIGYSRKGMAEEDLTIAIIPVGYADGLNRRLSNGAGKVIIKGQAAPIIGNICMDMCMVDVTNRAVVEGDEVEIFGEQYTAEQMAGDLGTIPYEVLTSISRRVKRVYYLE